MTRIIDSLAEVSDAYDALFCDLWGCVHNGQRPYPDAVAALTRFRAGGGKVVLLTNAPRQAEVVAAQLDGMGLPRAAWDAIASSGDAARTAMFRGAVGRKIYFIGEGRDSSFFDPVPGLEDPLDIERVPLDQAEGVVCTGPWDPLAPLEDLRPELIYAHAKGLKLLSANPDIVVDRGDTREWCAGAVAQQYQEMGGTVLSFGKPNPPIYNLARIRLVEAGGPVDSSRILAIGDGIATDIAGALGEDIDSLFITGGLAAEETKTTETPDPDALEAFLQKEMASPTFASGFLR